MEACRRLSDATLAIRFINKILRLRSKARCLARRGAIIDEQEALLVALKREGKDVSKVEAALEQMRENHRLRQQDGERLLSRLQP